MGKKEAKIRCVYEYTESGIGLELVIRRQYALVTAIFNKLLKFKKEGKDLKIFTFRFIPFNNFLHSRSIVYIFAKDLTEAKEIISVRYGKNINKFKHTRIEKLQSKWTKNVLD